MKNSDFLWQVSGYLQEEAKRCEKRGDELYDKQD